MRLRRLTHGWTLVLELAGMLGVAALIGMAFALTAARLIYTRLDPLPEFPPSPIFEWPVAGLLSLAAAGVVTALVGAWWVQHQTDRARIAEVIRLAG